MIETETSRQTNQVVAVGTLDTQLQRGKATTIRKRWNELQGHENQIMLQVRSPFGKPFRLPVQLEDLSVGRELLIEVQPGTVLAVAGELEWHMTTDPRYALDSTERGRRASELTFRAHTIRPAAPEDEPGCDVWLEGTVLTPARILPHPDTPLRIAVTTLRVNAEQTRKRSRARLAERAHVAVVIPLDHPDAPNLLRPGNQVVVEGMLERVLVPLSGTDVDRAVQALDEVWAHDQATLHPKELRDRERTYRKQRRRLREAVRTRVVAGYVELVQGTPATLVEAQQIRHEMQRERRSDQRERATVRETPAPTSADVANNEQARPGDDIEDQESARTNGTSSVGVEATNDSEV